MFGLSPLRCYKDNTFSREIQIGLTFRNTPWIVKMQRFAADGVWRVVYYEAARSGEKCTALCFCKVCVQRQFSLVNCSVCVLPENRVSWNTCVSRKKRNRINSWDYKLSHPSSVLARCAIRYIVQCPHARRGPLSRYPPYFLVTTQVDFHWKAMYRTLLATCGSAKMEYKDT